MNFPDNIPSGKSPRRELQGPRPTPLRVHKDSHKIKKPPLAPQPPSQPQPPPRQPIIIYTVSPKIIHTTPADFMNLVQRLTGSSSSSSSVVNMASNDPFNGNNVGMISPAARFATIENARSPQGKKQQHQSVDMGVVMEGIEMGQGLERHGMFQGILSPGPSALSPIPSSFFSPATSDPSLASFFHDLSPMLHGNRNFMEGSFIPSPSNFVSPHNSTPSFDLFNNFLDR
ncbi:hypothetical protein L6164_030378 [Bauhinia variegata]|uniref:Uncharacterized protein n=1 Tax=Bauhinia variegata TaxID=167791 RepID=A0ACB9LD13_BAUVA|nr:hypothetical protein L6164_030378 [Bauhinia variegata]